MRLGDGWVEVGGDVHTKADTEYVTVQIFMAETAGLNYMVDMASMTEIVHDPNWLAAADQRIDLLRKGNLRVT